MKNGIRYYYFWARSGITQFPGALNARLWGCFGHFPLVSYTWKKSKQLFEGAIRNTPRDAF